MFWKCQKLDIKKQYELGARVFDVRVYIKTNGIQHMDLQDSKMLALIH